MALPELTLRSLKARPLLLPLKRPVVARIATIDSWPLILIDLETEEGVVGRAAGHCAERGLRRGLRTVPPKRPHRRPCSSV